VKENTMVFRLIELLRCDSVIHDAEIQTFHRYQIAVAVLLVEASRIDRVVTADERGAVIRIVSERFGLVGGAALKLIALAEGRFDDTLEDRVFTNAIREGFQADERREVIEMLWEVVYADGRLAESEEALMHRLAAQLGVDEEALEAEQVHAFARVGLSKPRGGEPRLD